jgi:hypothetical protein
MQTGEDFAVKLQEVIPQSKVLLLLWSEQAAATDYVATEIKIAHDNGLVLVPIRLDNTTRRSFYLERINSTRYSELGPQGVADVVNEHLRVEDAPYPFGRLYKELRKYDSDFPRHLEACRLFIRFFTLVHIAKYVQTNDRSEDLNRRIENFLTLESLFADLDVTRRIMTWLEEHATPVHERYGGFFKLLIHKLPGTQEFEDDDAAADEFDKKHLFALCGIQNDLGEGSPLAGAQADQILCNGVRAFLRKAISEDWLRACRLFISTRGPGGVAGKPLGKPVELTADEAGIAKLLMHTPSGTINLDPLFALVRGDNAAAWEVGLLRKHDESASYFSPVASRSSDYSERPRIELPWGKIEITRSLPKVVWVDESASVVLNLKNHSPAEVLIPSIEERLPENLRSVDGAQTTVVLATDLTLRHQESRALEYQVRGLNVPGAQRSFAASTVTFLFRERPGSANVEGDSEILVQTIPESKLTVKRRIVNQQGELAGSRVPLDAELTVEVEVLSSGAGLNDVRLQEEFEGAVLLAGQSVIHSGAIDRQDRQPPIRGSYQLRVTGSRALAIRMAATSVGISIVADGSENRIEIDDLPPPRVAVRWKTVMRQGPDDLAADLYLENTGATAAYSLDIQFQAPANVTVSIDPPSLARLAAGAAQTVRVHLICPGVPSGSVRFTFPHHSVQAARFDTSLALDLNRVIAADSSALPLLGRASAREEIRRALTDPDAVLVNLYGERGVGKRRLLLAEIDRLNQLEGGPIPLYEFDCGIADSFTQAMEMFLDKIVLADVPVEERGSETEIAKFFRDAGMEEQSYKGYIAHLEALLYRRERANDGTWVALALLLAKIAKAKRASRLVVLFRGVSKFADAELEALTALGRYLQPPTDVRIVATTYDPLKIRGVTRAIEVTRLTIEESRELVDRTFIMPRASAALATALIDRSEQLPANLISLLTRLVEKSEALLDFSSPAGARIRDADGFRDLPTSLLESERRAAESSGIPEPLLACLAAFRGPFTADQVLEVLHKLDEAASPGTVLKALAECQKQHWLQGSGKKFEIVSATTRAALTDAVPPDLFERAHQALFTIAEEQNRPPEESFQHLVEAPVEFIAQRGPALVGGLRTLITNGGFSQVRTVLTRLRNVDFKLDATVDIELDVIEQELEWKETGDVDPHTAEALLQALKKTPGGPQRERLRTRLLILASDCYSRKYEEHGKAAQLAESAEHYRGPFRRLLVDDPRLEFEFYLNLWAIYYRSLDQAKFPRVDDWIWERLAGKTDGRYDSYAIASFLGLFLEFQQRFSSPAERLKHFPVHWVKTFGELRPAKPNEIEVRTRTERLRGSFLDEFRANPDKLEQNNMLVLGRLYIDLGASLWAQSKTRSQLDNVSTDRTELDDANAESYLERAESLLAEAGFLLDLANARSKIGDVCLDRLRLAERTGERGQLGRLSSLAAKWLQLAALDYEALDEVKEAGNAWEAYAGVMRRWASHQPEYLGPAIEAFERVIHLPAIVALPGKRDAHRLTLFQLYERAGRLDAAARILDEMEVQTVEVVQLRALIHAETLAVGTAQITGQNVGDFEIDLKELRSSAPLTRAVAGGGGIQLRSSEQAIGVIAWHLANFYAEQQKGAQSLETLRGCRKELTDTPLVSLLLKERLPALLPALWQMEGSADVQMTQDFSNLLLRSVDAENRPAVEQMFKSVWNWEAHRDGGPHLAAADMSMVLCESHQERGSEEMNRALAKTVFDRLKAMNVWETKAIPRMLARALTVILRASAASVDESILHDELERELDDLKNAQHYGAALWVVLFLVEMLLDVHRETKNDWFYEIASKLADQLRPLQEMAETELDSVTHLIHLYLQLPNGMTDAVDLMEKQCQELLDKKDYKHLPEYLSFLSDLLQDTKRQDLTEPQFLRTEAVREVATALCGRTLAEIRKQRMERSSERHVLYHAAKLLDGPETADLQAAIYAKLYDLADGVDGSCVWAVYGALTKDGEKHRTLSLEDCIALTTYSNCEGESSSGSFERRTSPRNYLINAGGRNMLLGRLMLRDPGNEELFAAYAELEIQRLGYLLLFIKGIHQFLEEMSDFDSMQWVTFLYGYFFSESEGAPFWQKLQEVENQRHQLEQAIDQLGSELSRRGILHGNIQKGMKVLSYRVQDFIVGNRRRGREIMGRLAERIRPYSLAEILGEVQRYMEGHERGPDFNVVLGLWTSGDESEAEAFLIRDPALLVNPLVRNGLRLLNQGEPGLAERMYRFALSVREAQEENEGVDLVTILRGITQSLKDQGKLGEARDMAIREVEILKKRSDPGLGPALEELADILEPNVQSARRIEPAASAG